MKCCALVVLYNPDAEVFRNINSYCDSVDCVILVDNSAHSNLSKFESERYADKSVYYPLGKNYGLAYALNCGCKAAIDRGYSYVLTMDQDSYFEEGAVELLKEYLDKNGEKVAIACPNIISLYMDEAGEEKIAYQRWPKGSSLKLNWCMTSGSLMSLKAYTEAGGFDDEMFIAHLDIDLGLKLHNNGYDIMMIGDSIIRQHYGNSRPKKILFKTVHPSYASPVRTYYLFRNQKYLEKKYGKEAKAFINVSLVKFFIKISLFEPQKIEKYKMMIKGIRHGKEGRMGEYK